MTSPFQLEFDDEDEARPERLRERASVRHREATFPDVLLRGAVVSYRPRRTPKKRRSHDARLRRDE